MPQLVAPPSGGDVAGATSGEAAASDPTAAATSDQTADAAAAATQQQPSNVVVIVRVDSPGNDGPVTQSNITVATPSAANGATTAQQGGTGTEPQAPPQTGTDQGSTAQPDASDQQSSTAQQATSTATATQDDAGNLVVTVRIDSPGRNGSITQANGAIGASDATNTSATNQQVAAPAPPVQPQARGKGAATPHKPPRRRHRKPGATTPAPLGSQAFPAATSGVDPQGPAPDQAAKPAARGRALAHRHKATPQYATAHAHAAVALSAITAGAARALSPFVHYTPTAAEAARPEDVSRAVLLTLVALAAAGTAAIVSRRVPTRRREASARARR